MNKVYLIESLMTSDPYEPSETLVWGIYTSRELAIEAFKDWVKGLPDKLTKQIHDWESQYLDNYKDEPWFSHFQEIREKAIAFALESLEEALKKGSVEDMYKAIPHGRTIFDRFGEIVSDKNDEMKDRKSSFSGYWYTFCAWKEKFNLCHVDEFLIIEREVNGPMEMP